MRRFPLKQVTSGTFSRATSKHTRSFSTGGKTIFGSRLLISACLVLTATSFALNNNKYNGITRPLTTTSLCEGAASSFEKDKFTETALFPPVQAYYKGMMKVSDIHTIAYSIYGNPNGKPILYVHGGPGGGTDPAVSALNLVYTSRC